MGTSLTLEFQQKKVQEEFMVCQAGIQQQHKEAQQRLTEELQKLGMTVPSLMGGSTMPSLLPPETAPVSNYAAPTPIAASFVPTAGVLPYVPPPTLVAAPRSISYVPPPNVSSASRS